eukprot:5527692-Pyramimonas_sp.AAC.1
MPSHKSKAWLSRNGFPPHWHAGNSEADRYAKLGAMGHPSQPQILERLRAAEQFGIKFVRLLS